jgi:AP-4 complex subunit epsilon-1
MSGMHLSKEFFELIKAIGESKSKQEEDRIIMREVNTLKKKLESGGAGGGSSPGLGMIPGSPLLPGAAGAAGGNGLNSNKKKAREFLVRVLYVEMLGHDGGFGYIKAVVSVDCARTLAPLPPQCGLGEATCNTFFVLNAG